MAGNVMEWVSDNNQIAKGGGYYSEPADLKITINHSVDENSVPGMGCRILMKEE